MDTDETKMDFTAEELALIPELNTLSYRTLVEHIAKDMEAKTGIYYIVPIIQSAHESRFGNSGLARKYCNLFGITATESWKSKGRPICFLPTFEYIKGKRVEMKREFRAYASWRESFEDWADLITRLNVYKTAYALLKDKSTVREGIREMAKSYASDPAYAKSLITLFDMVNTTV